ncbi:hypothetical protein MELB17_15327 [Marinobacter sp. ELB17]|nr:hypothetical protein MELB17_15327 [Marinobacter sp. ELB17]
MGQHPNWETTNLPRNGQGAPLARELPASELMSVLMAETRIE